MPWILSFAFVFALAYANGANDNFKGVATLYGSKVLGFRQALSIATVATAAGAVASTLLAGKLAQAFSGKGLVAPELVGDPAILVVVAGAAALTILLATWIGMPTSTTHALVGALIGVALVQSIAQRGGADFLGALTHGFLLPMLVSPILAAALALAAVGALGRSRLRASSPEGTPDAECLCVGTGSARTTVTTSSPNAYSYAVRDPLGSVGYGTEAECAERFGSSAFRFAPRPWLDAMHATSAGAVCFARALNDTPKIAALLLAVGGAGAAGPQVALVAAAMALGGLLQARKVAETISRRITPMSPTQGLTANLVTASLVIGASRLGVPVSTTHVSVGSILGLGAAQGTAQWRTVRHILATWLITLPLALFLSAAAWFAWSQWSPSA